MGKYLVLYLLCGITGSTAAAETSTCSNDCTPTDTLHPYRYRWMGDCSEEWCSASPPRSMPAALCCAFTLSNQIPVLDYYVNDANGTDGTHFRFDEGAMAAMMVRARAMYVDALSTPTALLSRKFGREAKIARTVKAMATARLTGKHVVVLGSTSPLFECLALTGGASHVTVLEYNRLSYASDRITTLQVPSQPLLQQQAPSSHPIDNDAAWASLRQQVWEHGPPEVVLVISALDHDGLGRYGDPIAPDGDLLTMQWIRDELLQPPPGEARDYNPLLVLSVPNHGVDALVWNLRRIYGPLRLPRLLAGWEEVRAWGDGGSDTSAARSTDINDLLHAAEPVWLLKRPTPS